LSHAVCFVLCKERPADNTVYHGHVLNVIISTSVASNGHSARFQCREIKMKNCDEFQCRDVFTKFNENPTVEEP
jgi:hypothetical protein